MSLNSDIRTAVEETIARHFTERIQTVYAGLQDELGIAGDIGPMEMFMLEEREAALAGFVGFWLAGSLSFDQAEALGMDGTLRT